jgi:ankyrin repeat protein
MLCLVVVVSRDLPELLVAIAVGDHRVVTGSLAATPALARARLARCDEFFIVDCLAQVYEGDTALRAAAFAYDVEIARRLVVRSADVRARNRRGAEPLHAAVMGGPGRPNWDPTRQRSVIAYLLTVGADPNMAALGGVTPLHRAVRNRCSSAVGVLLQAGANPQARHDRDSTPADLTGWTTGRGGVGSGAAQAEQQIIIDLLRKAGT